jgi:hypothetical protein
MQQHVSPKSLAAHATRSEGPVAALKRRYFADQEAYKALSLDLPNEEIVAFEEKSAVEMRAIDEGLIAARPTEVSEVIALLEVAHADFLQFHADENGKFEGNGKAIVFNALDSALRILRGIAD